MSKAPEPGHAADNASDLLGASGEPSGSASLPAPKINATVKWYSVAKGYGFARLQGDEQDRDVFLHHSDILDGLALSEGERILLQLGEGPRGPFGKKIERISSPGTSRPA